MGGGRPSKKAATNGTPDVEAAARDGTVSAFLHLPCQGCNFAITRWPLFLLHLFFFQLKKLTVAVLKDYLTSVGKKVTGKKQELIDAVMDHLGI